MDVRAQRSRRKRSGTSGRGGSLHARRASDARAFGDDWVGQRLGEWQAREVRIAHGFAECRGLTGEQLEDIYQETSVALLTRRYQSEEHLRNALHVGIKHRALNHHRDEGRRGRIFARHAPGIYALAEAGAGEDAPEPAALSREDRLVVSEFLTELEPLEQRVFWLLAEGMQYRAIAPALGIEKNTARKASRAVERKRERFQLFYDTGRLCGFRAQTILALKSNEATSEELAERAFAHLESCAHCRVDHKTNASALRRRFQGEAAALLPPVLAGPLGKLGGVDLRLKGLLQRLLPDVFPAGPGGVREGAIGLVAGGGAIAKATATTVVLGVAVVGGIGANQALEHHAPRHDRAAQRAPSSATAAHSAASTVRVIGSAAVVADNVASTSARRASAQPSRARVTSEREPRGFDILGVPAAPRSRASATASAAGTGTRASAASAGSASATSGASSGGGEFSP